METIRLPRVLEDRVALEALNRNLKAHAITLDWSAVEVAPKELVGVLLHGVDAVSGADAIGIDTIPDALAELIGEVLEAAPPPPPKPPTKSGTKAAAKKGAPPPAPPPAKPILAAPPAAEIREMLHDAVLKDLLGPAQGAHEEVAESSVRDRYLVGMLAPRKIRIAPEENDELAVEELAADDSVPERTSSEIASVLPSSFGLSCCVEAGVMALEVTARWGAYKRQRAKVGDEEKDRPIWKRVPMEGKVLFELGEGKIEPRPVTSDQPDVVVQGVVRPLGGDWIVTIFLVNRQQEPEKNREEAWIFQPELIVEGLDKAPVFRRRPLATDSTGLDPVALAERRGLEMVYRDHVEFAVGHGVGVHAEPLPGDPERASRVETRVVPTYDVPAQSAPGPDEIPELAGLVLDMKALAEMAPSALPSSLAALPKAYGAWIARQDDRRIEGEDRLGPFDDAAKAALDRARRARARIEEGIALIASDARAAKAFQFANRAMWQQRVRSIYAEKVRRQEKPDLAALDTPPNRSWRTFQLAFILLSLPSLTRLDHPDRSIEETAVADLLWFPTGGGKTEAYLGLTAYTLALRRLVGTIAGRSGEHGLAVLMRYTLRLLTLQQFQRAAALICASEVIRREDPAQWGKEPFRLGLWVGYRTTPNKTDDAAEALKQSHSTGFGGLSLGSPAQLTNCPWCGTEIQRGRDIVVVPYNKGSGRTLIYCGDTLGTCPFSKRNAPGEGVPAMVVDEEVYRRLPALLIATVDKFAQMPWNGIVQMLFGQVDGRCPRHGFRSPELDDADSHPKVGAEPPVKSQPHGVLRPPDLIIQDELHLISGPLGTLTGLYETAVDHLSTWEVDGKKVRPKVIASTATVRRAGEQVNGLFMRSVEVFPPHGLDVRDNFFSRQRDPKEVPGRRYIGICAQGRRLKAALIRVYVAYLAAGEQLFEKYGAAADPWMTLVGYFNSLRELAGMRRLVEDDVRSRLRDTDKRGLAKRMMPRLEELTSRKGATEIPHLLDRLELPFDPVYEAERRDKQNPKGKPPLDVLLATNMISVGVDVKRLGLMVVAGQPKTTAEYIQATSRVGRSHPGLVCTVYNWSRPRDLSHYEGFEQYHATFYQHVEALSVTPFASRALDRGLTGVLVSLIRLASRDFNRNGDAERMRRDHPLVLEAVAAIIRRAGRITGKKDVADLVEAMLDRRLDIWGSRITQLHSGIRLGYRSEKDSVTQALLKRAGDGGWGELTCLNSLRDVEPAATLILHDIAADGLGGAGEVW